MPLPRQISVEGRHNRLMSYRTIITVVDEHTTSTVTARYAIALAASAKSELVLFAAHEEAAPQEALRHTEQHLEHLFSSACKQEIPVSRITEAGRLTDLLPHRVRAEKADLVFYPLTPAERYGATLQRDPVHRLLRTVRADLAIMKIVHMGRPHPRHILVPLGGTLAGMDRRFLFVSVLATGFHSRVTLFHKPAAGGKGKSGSIARFGKELSRHHVEVRELAGTGHVGKSIAEEAIIRHNDLIVLGASERGLLRRLFFGNPAGDVMCNPPCNAVLFRAAPALP